MNTSSKNRIFTPGRVLLALAILAVFAALLIPLPGLAPEGPYGIAPDSVKTGMSIVSFLASRGEVNVKRRQEILTLYYDKCESKARVAILSGRKKSRVDKVIARFANDYPEYKRACTPS